MKTIASTVIYMDPIYSHKAEGGEKEREGEREQKMDPVYSHKAE